MSRQRGEIRDAIIAFIKAAEGEISVAQIKAEVEARLGEVPASSVRSYLNIKTPELFTRTKVGWYKASTRLKSAK